MREEEVGASEGKDENEHKINHLFGRSGVNLFIVFLITFNVILLCNE